MLNYSRLNVTESVNGKLNIVLSDGKCFLCCVSASENKIINFNIEVMVEQLQAALLLSRFLIKTMSKCMYELCESILCRRCGHVIAVEVIKWCTVLVCVKDIQKQCASINELNI